MTGTWKQAVASDVKPGDRVRLASGEIVVATRIEPNFMGRSGTLAFIEDTADRWYKRPSPASADVEVWDEQADG